MKFNKIFIILILIILTPQISNADFNWKKIGKNVSGSVFFVDKSSIKRKSDTVFFYLLVDYAKPSDNVLSVKTYIEGNCNKSIFRFLKDMYYDEPMGNGRVIETINETGDWDNYNQTQIMGKIMKYICKY
tara:strand:+ start:70 stop:459 length:390 start_codon:yes stop_codon:yes gene_type:complete